MQESIIFLFLYEHRYSVLTSYFLFIIAAMTFYKSRIENKIFTINSDMIVKKLSEKQKRVIVDSLVNEFKTLFTNR